MCKVYAGQNPGGYKSINRSIRIGGHSTSIQLEAVFWELLDEIAQSQHLIHAEIHLNALFGGD